MERAVFQLTPHEIAANSPDYTDERHEYSRRREFRLANFNSRDRDAMLDSMVEELGIQGGWFWRGRLAVDDHDVTGPYATRQEAQAAMQTADRGLLPSPLLGAIMDLTLEDGDTFTGEVVEVEPLKYNAWTGEEHTCVIVADVVGDGTIRLSLDALADAIVAAEGGAR